MTSAATVEKHYAEVARAKVNLTLRVAGRRPDGYHELDSIVAFADVGDLVTFQPDPVPGPHRWRLKVTGPFAAAITGENLIERALRLLDRPDGPAIDGVVTLDKRLPIASGIGGGSSDAAALLRALRRADRRHLPPAAVGWDAIAAQLGADVPVCLANHAARIRGIGERLQPLDLPTFAAVLVTPDAPVPADKTRRIFAALGASPVHPTPATAITETRYASLDALVDEMQAVGNDLEPAARSLVPAIAEAKQALSSSPGCRHAFLSGAGPTCVGTFTGSDTAITAARAIAAARPRWWVSATTIGN